MLWLFVAVVGVALTFHYLGSVTVWIGLLKAALAVTWAMIVGLGILFTARWIMSCRNRPRTRPGREPEGLTSRLGNR